MKIQEKIYQYSIFIFILVLLLDPTNQIIKLKEELLFILTIQFLLFYKKIKKKYLIIFLLYYLIPNIYASMTSFFNNIPYNFDVMKTALLGGLIGIFLIILSPVDKEDLLKITIKSLKIYSIIYLIIVVAYLICPLEIKTKIYEYSMNYKNMMIAPQIVFGYLPMIFYKTSPVLIIYFSYLLYNQKYKFSILIGFLLIMSGTAANLLSMILVICFYLVALILKNLTIESRIIIFGILSIIGIFLLYEIIFSSKDAGNTIKYKDLLGYLKFWTENIEKLIFGSGLGSSFYSYGRDEIVYATEMTYFEIIRIYGIILSSIIVAVLLYPLTKLIKNKNLEWLFISYLAYLFIGGTNPLIMSSTGSLVLILVYKLID